MTRDEAKPKAMWFVHQVHDEDGAIAGYSLKREVDGKVSTAGIVNCLSIEDQGESARLATSLAWSFNNALSSDDGMCADLFSDVCKYRLQQAANAGRYGWWDHNRCSSRRLTELLLKALNDGDMPSVANYAMFLFMRGESPDLVKGTIAKIKGG